MYICMYVCLFVCLFVDVDLFFSVTSILNPKLSLFIGRIIIELVL